MRDTNENEKLQNEQDPEQQQLPYEPPQVQSVKLTDEAAESLT